MEGTIGEDIGHIVEIVIMVIKDMDMVILGEVILEEDTIIAIEEQTGLGKIGECGDNLGQEKEIEIAEVDCHLALGRGQELV